MDGGAAADFALLGQADVGTVEQGVGTVEQGVKGLVDDVVSEVG